MEVKAKIIKPSSMELGEKVEKKDGKMGGSDWMWGEGRDRLNLSN